MMYLTTLLKGRKTRQSQTDRWEEVERWREREKQDGLWKSIMYLTFLSRLPASLLLSGRWGGMREERVRWQDLIYKQRQQRSGLFLCQY